MVILRDWTRADAAGHVRVPTAVDDKYSRSVVGLHTGSVAYPGAAVLTVEGAWRAGASLVRWSGPATVAPLVLQRRPETIVGDGRVGAWVIGSGTDAAQRSADETGALRALLAGDAPVVVDAGALDLAPGATAPLVVTPHAGEFARLRAQVELEPQQGDTVEARAEAAVEVAEALEVAVLLKGAETIVASPDGVARVVAAATPWLATAGAGDVLAGAVGALVASVAASAGEGGRVTASALADAAASAAWLHGRAARLAARADHGPGHPIVALDVADALPRAIAEALA